LRLQSVICFDVDGIQRKLALIDAQLTGGPLATYKQIIGTAPLLFAATGLIAGILLQNTLFEPRATNHEPRIIWFWLILLACSAVAAILTFALATKLKLGSFSLVLLSSCALICFTCLGAIRLIAFRQAASNDIRNFVGAERKLATIQGLIATEPYINNYGYYAKNPSSPQDSNETDDPNNYEGVYQRWKFAKFLHNDPATSFYLKVSEVETTKGWAKTTGNVRVQVAEPVLDLKVGDYIQAYCWLDRFKQPTNPGQFNVARYLARKNVFIAASVKSRDGIELLKSGSASIFTRVKRKLRQTATVALLGSLSPEDRNRGLLEALLLGYRGNIDRSTYRAFRRTGLLHFISLSGMHLGILMGVIWFLCRAAGLMKPTRAVICIIATGIFLLIVPPRAPTLRAAIICWVFCASFLFRRRSNPLNTLSLAAIILLLIRPTFLFEAGWQLSFASVLGLLLFCRRNYLFLYEKITGLPWAKKAPVTKQFFRIISRPGPYLLELFSTGLTAWLAGAGILLYHFYAINPLTSIWTVIAFPLVALLLTVGYVKIILSLLLPTVAAFLGAIVTGLAASLIWIVEHIASWHIGSWNISQILIGHVPLTPVILYYCFVLFAGFVYFRRPLIKKAVCTVMVVAIIAFLGVTKWQRTHRDNVVLTCLDVGHGQAIFAQLPGRANILFDAGSLYKSNVGRRVVAPFLDYIGTNKIDAIIISHNDVDHINGIPEIAESCNVNNIYANNAFFSKTDPWGTAGTLKSLVKIHRLGKDVNVESSAKIKMLWPSEQICQDKTLSDNDKSQVSLIEFAGTKILLCSDIEKFAQKELLRKFPNLRPDIVVVPHHGSIRTMDAEFLKTLDPDILICSCSRSQYEKQQVKRPIDNTQPFYTAKDGTIAVHIDSEGTLRAKTFAEQE